MAKKYYLETDDDGVRIVEKTVKKGLSFGSCLAMVISYHAWQSIPWAIFHGALSWIYVIYYWIKY
jgi:hypothetical protein